MAGFFATFLAVPEAVGVFIAALVAGLICSAETAPQISNSARPNASLCIDLGPVSLAGPKPTTNLGGNWSANRPGLNLLISPPLNSLAVHSGDVQAYGLSSSRET